VKIIAFVLLVLIIWLQYKIWLQDGGLPEVIEMRQEIAEVKTEVEKLQERNSSLDAEVKEFEPKIALADNADGLTFYKKMAEYGSSILNETGFIAVEHAYNQSSDVQQIFRSSGWGGIDRIKDFAGHDRCVVANRGMR